jgi:beta-xylosidase
VELLCPFGFSPQIGWPSQCRNCFRAERDHDDDGRKYIIYDSLKRKKNTIKQGRIELHLHKSI